MNKGRPFTVCTEQVRPPYNEHDASGLPNPMHLEGELHFVQAQEQQVTTHSPRIVTECILIRSMCSMDRVQSCSSTSTLYSQQSVGGAVGEQHT